MILLSETSVTSLSLEHCERFGWIFVLYKPNHDICNLYYLYFCDNNSNTLIFQEPENISPGSKAAEKILQWRNVDSLCWLNSLLSLLVNNVTVTTSLRNLMQKSDSLVRTLTESFNQAQELSSTSKEQAEVILKEIRGMIWTHLQPKMKCQLGVNDSPVAALPLLLQENDLVSERFLQVYHWEFSCSACGYQQIDK